VTLDFMLHRFSGLVENLRVYPERMKQNLDLLKGVVHSQRVLLELARKGMDRQAAYVIVQRAATRTYDESIDFEHALREDRELSGVMTAAEIAACLSNEPHLGHVSEIFQRVFGRS
jgi:adenylosuccinate lyase